MSEQLSIWCQSCARRVDCDEVRKRTHDGHKFGVADLTAYQMVRAYLKPEPCDNFIPEADAANLPNSASEEPPEKKSA